MELQYSWDKGVISFTVMDGETVLDKGAILHSIGGGERPSDEELDAFLLDALTGAGLLETKGGE